MESVPQRDAEACRGAKRRAREGSGEGRPPPQGWGPGVLPVEYIMRELGPRIFNTLFLLHSPAPQGPLALA